MHTLSQNTTHQPREAQTNHSSIHSNMVSLEEPFQAKSKCVIELISSPRISFSSEFLDENNFISICPKRDRIDRETGARNVDFEFLSGDVTNMIAADELFCEGKLLPFKQTQHAEKLNKIALKTTENAQEGPTGTDEERRISWFLDDDPSPRPPKCTVLWKELLRLKKQRASTLSPSSSSSSSESSSVDERKKGGGEREKAVSRAKKGLERTRSSSSSMRIRPMINVPICQPTKNASLPPLFPLRRGRLES